MRFINTDPKKASIKNGIMTIPTDVGYNLTVAIHPSISISEVLNEGTPGFLLDMPLGEMNSVMLAKDSNLIKTQDQLDKYLKDISHIPDSLVYDDFMIGFIYGNPNQDNFKWMFQLRQKDQVVTTMIFQNGIDIQCPISTYSWLDGEYHGRFIVDRNDLLKVVDSGPGRVKVIGKNFSNNPEGDTSIIPKECNEISLRFNVYKNRWYLHYFNKNKDLGDPTEVREIVADVIMKADTNRNTEKPKVTERIKVKDVASITVKAGVATILGKPIL